LIVVSFAFHSYYNDLVSTAAFTCLSDPMAMARAQELQEWDWEMENGHGGATHFCNGRLAC
jgi:hypothetical protein